MSMICFGKIMLLMLPVWSCSHTGSTDIALYADNGADANCITATRYMFEWMGYSVALIDAGMINDNKLDDFRLLCMPGGNMYQYSMDISATGKENIRSFISEGHAYLGICAGANFAGHTVYWQGQELAMTPLAIFPGTARGPIDSIAPYPECTMCWISIIDKLHPITVDQEDSMWVMYCYGPQLEPDAGSQVAMLANYSLVHTGAMAAFGYGEGRVFCVGAHPEFEEDSDRDGVNVGDPYDDRGSDWPFMKRAVEWCLKEECM
jgi:glutamine amidotransferase-like uncharacterized protein